MALSFNGSTSKLEWSGAIFTAYPNAMFAWIKPNASNVSHWAVDAANLGASELDELGLFVDGANTTKVRAYARDSGAFSVNAESTTAVQTSWQPALVVFTSNSSRTVYYAGGAAVTNTDPIGVVLNTFDLFRVGMRALDGTGPFAGEIAEVALWEGTVPGQTQFDSLAAGALPESIMSGSLVDSWSLETQASTQVGTVSRTLTATSTSQGGAHPISRSTQSQAPRSMNHFRMMRG